MTKIKSGDYVCLKSKLRINAYIHKMNIFEAYPENEETIEDNIIYLPGKILDVSKTYVYEPLNLNKFEYDAGLDLRYHVLVPIPQRQDRRAYQDGYDDEIDTTKIYYVNKFYKRDMGREQKRSDYKENTYKDDKQLPYKLYMMEPSRFYDKDGSYEMIPAEMDDLNRDSAYYNKGTSEPTIVKTNTKQILSMKPQGDALVNSLVDYTKLEGKLIDIHYPYRVGDLKLMKSLLDTYDGEIDEEYLRKVYSGDKTVIQVEISGMTVNFLLKHITFP